MKNNIYDIAIVGSGLSALTALKLLISKKTNKKMSICIITSNQDHIKVLANNQYKYFKNTHLKVADCLAFNKVDKDVLRASKESNLSLLSTFNLGGLGAFWGGGFFENLEEKNKIKKNNLRIIKKLFKVYELNLKKNKLNSYLIYILTRFRQTKCSFLIDKHHDNNIEILNPAIEILNICKKNKVSIFKNNLVKKLSYNKNLGCIDIISDNKIIFCQHILIGCGVFNSPKLLVNSKLIKNRKFTFFDHQLYRIPLINFKFLFEYFLKSNYDSDANNKKFTSLREAFFRENKKFSIFLGIYRPSFNLKIFNKLIKFFLDSNLIVFSQVFINDKKNNYKISGNLINSSYVFNKKNFSKLGIIKKIIIFIFFIMNGYIPIPFKYKQRFGSSYHVYGSLKDFSIINLPRIKKNESFVQVIDSSTLNKIGAGPSSPLIINNSLTRTEELLKKINLK
tara:strand:+ start:1733 stop:3085 length:1353 start_codon:yes stop_codon:yes gene_type:complete